MPVGFRRLGLGFAVACALTAVAHAAPPPLLQPLLDDGWTILGEDLESRAYYRMDAARTSEGYISATMVVDFPTRSIRVTREFDCAEGRMRNRGATYFTGSGLQGEGRELRGWNTWMGILFYETRPPGDYNGMLADRVCPEAVPTATAGPPRG